MKNTSLESFYQHIYQSIGRYNQYHRQHVSQIIIIIIIIIQKLFKEFTFEFRGKIRAQLPESVQSLDAKSIKSHHATKWTKITNEMKAFINFDMGTYTSSKDIFINYRRAAI